MPEELTPSTRTMRLGPGPFGGGAAAPPDEADEDAPRTAGEESITVKSLEVRLGDRPVCRNLRRLYELAHRELPADMAVFEHHDIWSITHVIGAIHRQDSYPKVRALGYEADFQDAAKVLTVEILPRSKFVTVGEVKSETQFDLGLEGQARPPEAVKTFLDQVEYLGGDASIKLSSDLKIVGRVSFSVMTPVIQAVGLGASRCEWLFEAEDKPLLGDQIMLQTVLVPRGTRKLKFKARGYALVKPGPLSFPATLYTDWLDLECQLA